MTRPFVIAIGGGAQVCKGFRGRVLNSAHMSTVDLANEGGFGQVGTCRRGPLPYYLRSFVETKGDYTIGRGPSSRIATPTMPAFGYGFGTFLVRHRGWSLLLSTRNANLPHQISITLGERLGAR